MDQTCPFRSDGEEELAARAVGGRQCTAASCDDSGGCKCARRGKMAGIRLGRRGLFERTRSGGVTADVAVCADAAAGGSHG